MTSDRGVYIGKVVGGGGSPNIGAISIFFFFLFPQFFKDI